MPLRSERARHRTASAHDVLGLPPTNHDKEREEIMSENIAADQLRLLIERIERLEEEKKGIGDDIKDVYLELKATGFDVKTVRKIVAMRKKESHVRSEEELLLATYCAALGMQMSFDI